MKRTIFLIFHCKYKRQARPKKLLEFLTDNKYLIISDIIKGRGMLCAEWFLVSRFRGDGVIDYCLKNINEVINHYAQGNVQISPKGRS